MKKTIILVSRLLVGIVFVFSGFVKGVDPLGTAYRIEDYFIVFHLPGHSSLFLSLSILLCTFEFTLGVLLLLNMRRTMVSWFLLLIMSFFTLTTFYDALYNPVPDCGCFGDAIKLTNWQTFLKNILLFIPVIILFLHRKKAVRPFSRLHESIISTVVVFAFVFFSLYNYLTLPLIDFLPWKVGSKVTVDNSAPPTVYLTYKNLKTDEMKEFLSSELPYNDSVWMNSWEFVKQRVVSELPEAGTMLQISDTLGNDVTNSFLQNSDYQFLLIAYDLNLTRGKAFKKINQIFQKAEGDGYSFIALYSNGNPVEFAHKVNANYEFYTADDVMLKMMVRSNPGLVLLKNGVVIAKWSYFTLPDYYKIKAAYIKKH